MKRILFFLVFISCAEYLIAQVFPESRNSIYQFWQQDNQPKELFSDTFSSQKLNYIHNNPVEAGLVDKAKEYLYCSARDYYFGKNVGLLKIEFL